MQYYYCIDEHFRQTGVTVISSSQLAKFLVLDDSQIRKDLATLGVKGHPRVGFDIDAIHEAIQTRLGLAQPHAAVLIGAGRLGGAIGSYKAFLDYGLKIIALFDIDSSKIGMMVGNHLVQPVTLLESIVKKEHVQIGILTVPSPAAQESANRLVRAGIDVIWNFAPTRIDVPQPVFVRHERLHVGLAELFYHLGCNKDETQSEADRISST